MTATTIYVEFSDDTKTEIVAFNMFPQPQNPAVFEDTTDDPAYKTYYHLWDAFPNVQGMMPIPTQNGEPYPDQGDAA